MKKLLLYVRAFVLLSILNSQLCPLHAQGTAFTYQGQLQNNGGPANGSYNLTFTLFNTSNAVTAIVGPVTNNAVNVTNGLFTVQIDFGADVFIGQTNWLQIGVASNGVSAFTTLSPLEELTPVPEAIYANSASNLLGALPSAQLSGMVALAQLPTAVVTTNETTVTLDNLTLDGTLYLPSPEIMSDGDSLLYASITNANLFAGLSAGNPAQDTGGLNTANGNEALYNNTNGSENTAIGDTALFYNTSGSENTAIGVAALLHNVSGNENTANGVQALFNITSGSGNTAHGYGTLYTLTNGCQNIALGFGAGNGLFMGNSNIDIGSPGVTGDNNVIRIGSTQTNIWLAGTIYGNGGGLTNLALPTAVVTTNETTVTLDNLTLDGTLYLPSPEIMSDGDSLLYASITNANLFAGLSAGNPASNTGDNNTAIGNGALYSNTNGIENTVIGSQALSYNTSGSDNTAIGFGALPHNTTGSNNTANGVEVLFLNTSGSGNTANGYGALYSLTNGSGNIALGFGAGNGLYLGNSNIDIGNLGLTGDNNIIRIGSSQTATWLAGNVYASGAVFSNGVDIVSDRNAKEGFAVINPQSVLEKVVALPVMEWNYKTTKNLEHIGPMAQDFHAAFGLNGQDDKHISVVDEGGVALAAIQGLNQVNQKLQAELNHQVAENAKLEQRIEKLEQRMNHEAAQ